MYIPGARVDFEFMVEGEQFISPSDASQGIYTENSHQEIVFFT